MAGGSSASKEVSLGIRPNDEIKSSGKYLLDFIFRFINCIVNMLRTDIGYPTEYKFKQQEKRIFNILLHCGNLS